MAYIRLSDGVKKGFEQDMVTALSKLGYYAMMDAYKKREFRHRTRNLHDSYASAVYVGGNLIKSSVRYVGGILSRKVDKRTKKTGRQTVDDYLNSHHFGATNNEIVLVVIAAMYYAKILEASNGTGLRGPADRIIVISPARQYINQHYMDYVSSVYAKYGIKGKPKAIVIKSEKLRTDD